MNNIGYKVVFRSKQRKYYSFRKNHCKNYFNDFLRYHFNKWVEPKDNKYPIFLFKKLNEAINFKNDIINNQDLIIFKCEYVEIEEKRRTIINRLNFFPPDGTTFAKSIKLIEKIKY